MFSRFMRSPLAPQGRPKAIAPLGGTTRSALADVTHRVAGQDHFAFRLSRNAVIPSRISGMLTPTMALSVAAAMPCW